MAAWANLHGSFVIGLGMIACALFGDLVSLITSKKKGQSNSVQADAIDRLKMNGLDLVVAIVGSSLNPRGLGFLKYVFDYASNPIIRFNSQESRPMDIFVGMPVWAFLLLLIIGVGIWVYSKKISKPGEMLFVIAMFCGGVYSMRIEPYFALVALPAIATAWPKFKERLLFEHGAKPLKAVFDLETKLDEQESTKFRDYAKPYALFAAGVALWLFMPFFKISDYDPERIPVEATNWLINKNVEGLGFQPDNWGDYLYWRRQKPVFIDDKGDFYTPEFDKEYISVYTGQGDWRGVISKYKIDWLMLPNALPLVQVLKTDPLWDSSYRDDLVSVFVRRKS